VQLYKEEGICADLVAKELGVNRRKVWYWIGRYNKYGESGLCPQNVQTRDDEGAHPVRDKIVELKRENPLRGVKRISQMLRRLFCLKASPETVRRHLKKTDLGVLKVKKARKKPEVPARRFEASTPNQMWQSDITYYPVLGKTAYIVGFIDDNSRYITGLGVYRSQTGESVLETYRVAVGAYGVPKEMLTDNGRQYASWRGITQFQKELQKDHVHHIRSAPHHPQTLGKIERFWQTLKDEFLSRARFETFEEAKERIAYWVKYYNHQRTHQSLEGLTPADRFFGIQKELKEVIERRVEQNVQELALRGKPVEPFYMVGRVGDKNVVIETDKRRLSVTLDGEQIQSGEAMLYKMKERTGNEEHNGNGGKEDKTGTSDAQREGEEPGSAVAVERQEKHGGGYEADGCAVGSAHQLGEASDKRDAAGAGSDMEATSGAGAAAAEEAGEADGKDIAGGRGYSNKIRGDVNEGIREDSVRGSGEVPDGAGGMDGEEKGVGAVQADRGKQLAVMPVAGSCAVWYAGGIGTAGSGRDGRRACAADDDKAAVGPQGAFDGAAKHWADDELAQSWSEGSNVAGNALTPGRFLTGEVNRNDGSSGREDTAAHEGDAGALDRQYYGDGRCGFARSEPNGFLRVEGQGIGVANAGDAGPAERSARETQRS
jgi:transposase InsO family protein